MDAINSFLKSVPDKSICDWFFFMYILALLGAVFQLIMIVINTTIFMRLKVPVSMKGGFIFGTIMAIVVLGIVVTNSLFLYSMCDRTLVRDKPLLGTS
jgi:hypothetical protein